MGSDGGGAGIQWADTLISAGATFFAAVLAAAVAVWLANRERKAAEKQRKIEEDRREEQRRLAELKVARSDLVHQVEELIERLEHFAFSASDGNRWSHGVTNGRLVRAMNDAREVHPELHKRLAQGVAEVVHPYFQKGDSWTESEWARGLALDLSMILSRGGWSAFKEEIERQATSANDESSAEESDAKSSS